MGPETITRSSSGNASTEANTNLVGFDINTPRVHLRPVSGNDAPGLWPFVTDPEITRFLAWDPHEKLQQTVAMVNALQIAQQAGKGFHWGIWVEGQIAGLISLIDVKRTHRCWTINSAELAYWIGRPYQGRGLATEAAGCVLDFAFSRLHFNKISLYHAAQNTASGAIPLKLGFRYVGEQREAFCKDGLWHSLKQFELLRSEYTAQYGEQHHED